MLETVFTFYIFIVMSIITKIHVYWMQGGLWPGVNTQDLIDKVIGRGTQMPSAIAFLFVLSTFVIMALFPLGVYYKVDLGINSYEKYVFLVLAIIFAARSISMFIPVVGNRATKIFLEYNSKFYTPLCISLSISYFYLYALN